MKVLKYLAILLFDFIDKYIHQKNIVRFLKKKNFKISSYIDIGAHKGTYIDLFLSNFNLRKVFAFEPQPGIFKKLKKKYKKQSIKKYDFAISNSNGFKVLKLNKHDLTSSFTNLNEDNLYLRLKSKLFQTELKNIYYKEIKVKTIKLSTFISKNKLKKVDLLKIDTEGHEMQVLKGLSSEIKKIKIILIEFHKSSIYKGYNANKIHNHLVKNNFILKKNIKFPLTTFEDRIYVNKKNIEVF